MPELFFLIFVKSLITMTFFAISFLVVGFLQPLFEWAIHKYILHPFGAKKGSFFHYHWEHHNRCRKNNNIDQEYVDMFNFKFSPMIKKELFFMVLLNLTSVPVLLLYWPVGVSLILWQWIYFLLHADSHTREYLPNKFAPGDQDIPWHGEHHMGPDQNMNWSIIGHWPDRLFGTSTLPRAKDQKNDN